MDNDSDMVNEGPLLVRVRSDPAAFVQLYRRHYDAVFRYCVHRLFERATAEDITCEVFLKVVESFGRFKGNEQQFRNWLYRIATNACNHHLRRSARRKSALRIAFEQANDPPRNYEESSGKLALLRQAMLTLKPRYQTIITLRFFEKMKMIEIAEVLGSSPGTVRSQLTRALVKLRAKMSIGETAQSAGGSKDD